MCSKCYWETLLALSQKENVKSLVYFCSGSAFLSSLLLPWCNTYQSLPASAICCSTENIWLGLLALPGCFLHVSSDCPVLPTMTSVWHCCSFPFVTRLSWVLLAKKPCGESQHLLAFIIWPASLAEIIHINPVLVRSIAGFKAERMWVEDRRLGSTQRRNAQIIHRPHVKMCSWFCSCPWWIYAFSMMVTWGIMLRIMNCIINRVALDAVDLVELQKLAAIPVKGQQFRRLMSRC